jgi:hypothetical protein
MGNDALLVSLRATEALLPSPVEIGSPLAASIL